MNEPTPQELDPTYGEQEDTDETGLAAKIPLVRWYLRTTKGFGRSRSFFMPIGFLALGSLACYLGFSALEELTAALLLAIHSAFFALGDLFSAGPEAAIRGVLDLSAGNHLHGLVKRDHHGLDILAFRCNAAPSAGAQAPSDLTQEQVDAL